MRSIRNSVFRWRRWSQRRERLQPERDRERQRDR